MLAARSSQIILPMQTLERSYQANKESEAVLVSSYYKQRAGPQKVPKLRLSKMLRRNIRTKNSNLIVKK